MDVVTVAVSVTALAVLLAGPKVHARAAARQWTPERRAVFRWAVERQLASRRAGEPAVVKLESLVAALAQPVAPARSARKGR